MTTTTHWFIRARLKTRQLLLLVALAEEGNIHRAAQVLNMTQPAASKLLKDLEDVLEVPLFERLPRGMRPTWYGETMIRHARVALGSLNQAHDELQALKAGTLRPGERRRHHRHRALALLPPAVAIGQARAAEPAGLARDRDQPGAAGAAGAGQARHPGGPPVGGARQVAAALPGAHRGAGLRRGAAGPSAAGHRRAWRCATWSTPAGSCRRRAACCGTASSSCSRRTAGAADQHGRDRRAAVHHPHAAAERHAGGAGGRRGALLRGARHRGAAAAGDALPHGQLRPHHPHRPPASRRPRRSCCGRCKAASLHGLQTASWSRG